MRYLLLPLLAASGLMVALPASAQSSFARTCRDIDQRGDRLIAECRTVDGRWVHTELDDVDSCVGDIANMDGRLTCSRREERRYHRNWR